MGYCMDHKVGDTVRITRKPNECHLNIGDIVVIAEIRHNGYYKSIAPDGIGDYFDDTECELVKSK